MKKQTVQQLIKRIGNSFTKLCKEAGVNEADYVMLASGTPKEMVDKCLDRLYLYCKVFNQGEKVDMANTSQWKHWPYFKVIKDTAAPRGFRLAFRDFSFDGGYANLGARPLLLDEDAAIHLGTEFVNECVELTYWNEQCCNQ